MSDSYKNEEIIKSNSNLLKKKNEAKGERVIIL